MPKSYFFSINLLIKNELHLPQAVGELMADRDFFLEHVQLLLIDTVCSSESIAQCLSYSEEYPDNIFFIDASGKKPAACYNDARELCAGQYTAYIDDEGQYAPHTLKQLYAVLSEQKPPIAAVRPMVLSGQHTVDYLDPFPSGTISLEDTPDRFILMLGCYFFDRSIIASFSFDTGLKFHSEDRFILEALLKTGRFFFAGAYSYTCTCPTERDFLYYEPQYSRYFYITAMNDFVIPMLQMHESSAFVQSVMSYLIDVKFSLNQNDRYKYAVSENYVKEFFHAVRRALQYIDDCFILNKRLCFLSGLDAEFPFCLIRLKYDDRTMEPEMDLVLFKDTVEKGYYESNGKLLTRTLNGEFAAHVRQAFVASSKSIAVQITAINFVKDRLVLEACLDNCSFLKDGFEVYALVNQQRTAVTRSQVYSTQTVFEMPFVTKFAFRFTIPVSPGKQIDNACLMMKYQTLSFRLHMRFDTLFARLSSAVAGSFWCFGDKILTYNDKTRSFVIRRATESLTAFYENKFLSGAGKLLSFGESLHYRQLRKSVRRLKKDKMDCKYFVFYDTFGINSNGNLLFRFFSKARKARKFIPFFIAEKNSLEYHFLLHAGYENILEKGSKKAKTVILAADVIFASDSSMMNSLGFDSCDMLFLRDMLNARIISVKNFFMTYDTAPWDHRLKDNVSHCFCASETEKQNLLHPAYGYTKEMISVTGYPVLDSTANEKEKLILIAPGNRRQFLMYNCSDDHRFSESTFFKTYNALMTDPALLDALKAHDYHIAVLMPPSIEKHMRSFFSNDMVGLHPYTEKNLMLLVSKAAVMVTDYSELLYKMAYMNKPVIYYLAGNLPLQSEYRHLKEPNSCLGEVFTEHTALVQYLVDNIPKDFPQPSLYEQRCNRFFAYRDNKNSRRIFEIIMQQELGETT